MLSGAQGLRRRDPGTQRPCYALSEGVHKEVDPVSHAADRAEHLHQLFRQQAEEGGSRVQGSEEDGREGKTTTHSASSAPGPGD